jgi:GT2 family glycosyltransferase
MEMWGAMAEEPSSTADVEIIMVPRERYAPTVDAIEAVTATAPDGVRLVVVRGGMPRDVVRSISRLRRTQVDIVGPHRHLAPNAARSIGLAHTSARYVIFVDNDIAPSPMWVEPLLRTAAECDAWAVRPLVLQEVRGRVTVHESGGDCHLERRGSFTTLVETHRHLGMAADAVPALTRERVELFEFHTVLFDRARLVALGGPDERMLSQGDHLDLALRVNAAGGSIWLEPRSGVTYGIPERVGIRDLPFFLGRWSPSWNAASRRALSLKHGVDDPGDPYRTWGYPESHRTYAWVPLGRTASAVSGHSTPLVLAARFDRFAGRHLAELSLRMSPRWRGGGLQQES